MQRPEATDMPLEPLAVASNSERSPSSSSLPHEGSSAVPVAHTAMRDRPPTSPLVHLAVLTSVIVLPYLLVRRQLVTIRRTVSEMRTASAIMRRDLKAMTSEAAVRHHEQQSVLQLVRATKESLDELKRLTAQRDAALHQVEGRLERELRDTREKLGALDAEVGERDVAREKAESAHHAELKALLRENQWSKAHLEALKDMGTSLADVAAFMQEVELKEGYTSRKDDGRGIERIRQLALKLNHLMTPKVDKSTNAPKKPSNPATGSTPDKADKHDNPGKSDETAV